MKGKLPRKKHQTMEDRISNLPYQILHSILLLLTIKEAARTSILSSRWRDFFRSFMESISILNFDVANMIGDNYPHKKFRKEDSKMLLQQERDKYVRWVDQILQLHQRLKIDAFSIKFYMGKASECHLDRWIGHAMGKGVQKLDLDLSKLDFYLPDEKFYEFPCHLLTQQKGSYVKHLRLKCCTLNLQPDISGFNSLVTLTLDSIRLTNHVDILLLNCSLLEWLTLKDCFSPATLNIKGPSLQLKHLNITMCHRLERIEICASSLASFEYRGLMTIISFKNVPKLVRSSLAIHSGRLLDDITYALYGVTSHLPQLEILYLQVYMTENMLRDKLPTFTNLKQLVLSASGSKKHSLLGFTSLLEAAPFLEIFELHFCCSGGKMPREMQKKTSKCTHNNLKEVNLYGFGGRPDEIELALYLLKNAIALKKMKIAPTFSSYHGNGNWEVGWKASGWTNTQRKTVYNLLQREALPGVQLVIL